MSAAHHNLVRLLPSPDEQDHGSERDITGTMASMVLDYRGCAP
jgi:hypothetical protein